MALAMTLIPINGTLNRVMIKELSISATLVAILASFPYLFSPIQVLIGSFSDRFPVLGWRRTPYILLGLGLCVGGVLVSPQVAYTLVDNFWAGIAVGVFTFGAWGMGYNFASVSYFSLASEISGEKGRSRTIAVMFFMMIVSIILTSYGIGHLLEIYSFQTLERAFRIVGLLALILGLAGILGLEERQSGKALESGENYSWVEMVTTLMENPQVKTFFVYLTILLVAILGQDILLEPFGAEAFGLPVDATTRITSIWGVFFLVALIVGGMLETRVDKLTQARLGAWSGAFAFSLIVLSGLLGSLVLFYVGVVLLGAATGIATVSNLSLMLDMTMEGRVGLFIGAWGMSSAFSRMLGNLLSGVVRDSVTRLVQDETSGYLAVFSIEISLILVSLYLLRRVDVDLFKREADQNFSYLERATLANDIG
jgi:BCD family chlorophyll transporter-like MFS transporter